MSEDRFWELVNREVDGELSEGELAELDLLARENPDLAACRAEMMALPDLLDGLSESDPPDSLRTQVAHLIEQRQRRATKIVPVKAGFSELWSRLNLRPVYMFASGALAGAALLTLVFRFAPGTLPVNNDEFTGTILYRNQSLHYRVVSTRTIETESATGKIVLARADGIVTLGVDLTTNRPVRLEVGFTPEELAAVGFSSSDNLAFPVAIQPGLINVDHSASGRYDLIWSRIGFEATELRVVIYADVPVYEDILKLDTSD